MSDVLLLYCLILRNFDKLSTNAISESWFIYINVYVSYKMGLAKCFVSFSNINAVYIKTPTHSTGLPA